MLAKSLFRSELQQTKKSFFAWQWKNKKCIRLVVFVNILLCIFIYTLRLSTLETRETATNIVSCDMHLYWIWRSALSSKCFQHVNSIFVGENHRIAIPLSHRQTVCDQVCQWLTAGRWFSPGTPVSSTNKIDPHDITEILFKWC